MFTRRAAAAGRGVLQTLRVSPGSKRGGDEEVRGLAAAGVAGAAGCCETHTCHITRSWKQCPPELWWGEILQHTVRVESRAYSSCPLSKVYQSVFLSTLNTAPELCSLLIKLSSSFSFFLSFILFLFILRVYLLIKYSHGQPIQRGLSVAGRAHPALPALDSPTFAVL